MAGRTHFASFEYINTAMFGAFATQQHMMLIIMRVYLGRYRACNLCQACQTEQRQ
jgi:hypothetical protein